MPFISFSSSSDEETLLTEESVLKLLSQLSALLASSSLSELLNSEYFICEHHKIRIWTYEDSKTPPNWDELGALMARFGMAKNGGMV